MCKLAFLDTVFIFPRKFPKKSYFICAFIQFERMQEIYRHIISLDTDEFNRTFDTNQKCLDFIIRELYDGEVRSPFCDSKAYPMKEFGRYKCAKTRKTFYITRNTIFYRSHIPLKKWFAILYLFVTCRDKFTPSLLTRAFPETVRTMKTAIYVVQRISYACMTPRKAKFSNSQVDETPIGGHQHVRSYPDKCPKKVYKNEDKRNVLCIAEENNGWVDFSCVNESSKDLPKAVRERVASGATVTTDETSLFKPLNGEYDHRSCNHGRHLYINDGDHTNAVENRNSQFKRSMDGASHNNIRFENAGRYCALHSFLASFNKLQGIPLFKVLLYNSFQGTTFHPLSTFKLDKGKRGNSPTRKKRDGSPALKPGPFPQTPRHRNPEAYTSFSDKVKDEILWRKALAWYDNSAGRRD